VYFLTPEEGGRTRNVDLRNPRSPYDVLADLGLGHTEDGFPIRAAAGASLLLVLIFGGISNAVRGEGSQSLSEGQASAPNAVEQADHDATATVTRVVDGDTIEISPSVEGLSTVRLIRVDTPETHGGTQPYGAEASDFTHQNLEGKVVSLELDVQKVDPYGRLLAYVYLPNGEMFNEKLLEEGYAQVATFPPNVKYVDRFLEVQRGARAANRGLWGLSAGELCQQTDRGNGIGGRCSGSEPEGPPASQSTSSAGNAGDSNLDCARFETHEERHSGFWSKTRATRTTSMATTTAWRAKN
jgi:micrococcal nuclease